MLCEETPGGSLVDEKFWPSPTVAEAEASSGRAPDEGGFFLGPDEFYGDDGALYRLIDWSWHEVIRGGPPQLEDWELDEEEVRERLLRATAKWSRIHANLRQTGSPPARTRPVRPARVPFRARLRAPRPTARARQPRRRSAANRRPVAPARLGDAAPPGDGPSPTSRGAAAGGAQ